MSPLPDIDYGSADLPEISNMAFQKIDRWRDALDQTPKIDKRSTFEAAAADLYAEAQHETALAAFQSIEDDIRILGQEHAGLDANDVDFIMVGAKFDAGGARNQANGHAAVDGPPPATSPDEFRTTGGSMPAKNDDANPIVPAKFISPAAWPSEAPPPVDWLVVNRIPRGDVTTLHGDGGAGKTDITLRLFANVARHAQEWLGHELAAGGKVLFVSGEEPERELWRRMWLHSLRDGYRLGELADNFRLWMPDKISDAAMAVADRYTGIMRPTDAMLELAAGIEQMAPIAVAVDNVAATFAGNQNDRVSVRSFVNLWRQIAHGPSKPAVLLLDHPSLSGLTAGSGRGGNMDWRNAVRSALHLHAPSDSAEAAKGVRVLETAKSNYGPPGNPVRLLWSDGGLQLEHAPSSHHRAAKEQQCDEIFLRLLDERAAQGGHVGRKTSGMYAPKVFAAAPDNGGIAKSAFALAMERLFVAGTIREVWDPKRRHDYIERAASA
jgi:RecA-family ATPase